MVSHRSRLEDCLAGALPDRPPVALWRHFPVDDQDPFQLAAATAAYQTTFDFDLVKVTPASSFCLRDWGVVDAWEGAAEGTRAYGSARIIQNPEDWEGLRVLDPKSGALSQQIRCLELLVEEFKGEVPIIQTIFSPLAQAKNLAGQSKLLHHMRRSPEALHQGLRIIAVSTRRFVEAARKTGIDGIFYAVQHAQDALLSEAEYLKFGKFFDLMVLEAADGLWLNILHIHGSQIMFDLFLDYPMAVVNWHDQETPPSLRDGLELLRGAACGGLDRWEDLVLGTPSQIREKARRALEETGGRRLVLGTGCVTPITAPFGNILAVRQSVGFP